MQSSREKQKSRKNKKQRSRTVEKQRSREWEKSRRREAKKQRSRKVEKQRGREARNHKSREARVEKHKQRSKESRKTEKQGNINLENMLKSETIIPPKIALQSHLVTRVGIHSFQFPTVIFLSRPVKCGAFSTLQLPGRCLETTECIGF